MAMNLLQVFFPKQCLPNVGQGTPLHRVHLKKARLITCRDSTVHLGEGGDSFPASDISDTHLRT